MLIRSGIFLVAGLIMILFPDQILKLQSYFFKKFKVNDKDERTYRIFGLIFLIIAVILFIWGLLG